MDLARNPRRMNGLFLLPRTIRQRPAQWGFLSLLLIRNRMEERVPCEFHLEGFAQIEAPHNQQPNSVVPQVRANLAYGYPTSMQAKENPRTLSRATTRGRGFLRPHHEDEAKSPGSRHPHSTRFRAPCQAGSRDSRTRSVHPPAFTPFRFGMHHLWVTQSDHGRQFFP